MQIEITVDATQFLRARGGALYAWEERDPDSGDRRVRTSYRAPRGARDFVEYHRPGVTFLRESSLPAPRVVSVSLRRFPFTRLLARYGGSSAQEQLTATDLAFEILEIALLVSMFGLAFVTHYALLIFPIYGAIRLLQVVFTGSRPGHRSEDLWQSLSENPVQFVIGLAAVFALLVLELRLF